MTTVFNLNRYDKIVANDLSLNGTISTALGGLSQWEDSGSDIYFSSGNVGIGTTSPDKNLHIHSSGTNYLRLTSGSLSNGLDFATSTGGDAFIVQNEYANLRISTNATERMRIDSNGNVGIGTTSPAKKLHVSGQTRFAGNLYAYSDSTDAKLSVYGNTVIVGSETSGHHGYKFYIHGGMYASGSVDEGSDNRIKHNEQPIQNALETMRKLQPYHYIKTESLWDENHNFNLDSSNNPVDEIRYDSSGNQLKSDLYDNSGNAIYRREDGIIAQDILQIPELAHTVVAPQNDIQPYGVNYNSILIRGISALQEVDRQQQTDKAKIASLETQVAELLTRLTALENAN